MEFMKIILLFLSLQFYGCFAHHKPGISQNLLSDDLKVAKNYSEYLSVIENYELLMRENFKRKQMLMVKSSKQESILHRKHDLKIRTEIMKSFSGGFLQKKEKDLLLTKCGDLHKLWQKQRKQIQTKRFQLGLIR